MKETIIKKRLISLNLVILFSLIITAYFSSFTLFDYKSIKVFDIPLIERLLNASNDRTTEYKFFFTNYLEKQILIAVIISFFSVIVSIIITKIVLYLDKTDTGNKIIPVKSIFDKEIRFKKRMDVAKKHKIAMEIVFFLSNTILVIYNILFYIKETIVITDVVLNSVGVMLFCNIILMLIYLSVENRDDLKEETKEIIIEKYKETENDMEDLERELSLAFEDKPLESVENRDETRLLVIRVISFLFFFSTLFSMTFLPVYIQKIFTNLGNNQNFKEIFVGIIFGANVLGTAIGILLSDLTSRNKNVKTIFIMSNLLLILGCFLTIIAKDIYTLLVARTLAGLGVGGYISGEVKFVLRTIRPGKRAQAFGQWIAGFASGFFCASLIGGMAADFFGFERALMLELLFYLILLINVYKTIKAENIDSIKDKIFTMTEFSSFFKNKRALSTLFLSNIPIQMLYIGFIQMIFPLYLKSMERYSNNVSLVFETTQKNSATTGKLMAVFSLIYFVAPLISAKADKTRNYKKYIILGGIIAGGSLLLFNISSAVLTFDKALGKDLTSFIIIWIMFLLMVLLSLGSVMQESSEESYVSYSNYTKNSAESVMTIYMFLSKLFSAVIPIAIGFFLLFFGYVVTVNIIGICVIGFSILLHLESGIKTHRLK